MSKHFEAVRRADAYLGVTRDDSDAAAVAPVSVSHNVCAALGEDAALHRLSERVTASASVVNPARLLLTGCRPGDGASTVAIALALDLSQRLAVTTLLVDAHLRRPTLHRMLDGARPSDTGVRSERSYLLKRTGLPRLDLATCKPPTEQDWDERFAAIEKLMTEYPVAIVDLGVARLDPAGLLLARAEDPILLVARYGHAERGQLSATVNAITVASRSIGGVILNRKVSPLPRWVRRVLFLENER